MKFNKFISAIVGATLAFGLSFAASSASEYPSKHPKHEHWSFAGPFGHWDIGQLQRGLKVYKEVCSACHGMEFVAFRDLTALGYSDAQVKAFAGEYEFDAGDDETRPGKVTDYFPSPFASKQDAADANGGAVPPDFSLLAKARAPERGFPTFIFDIFTLYAENGPDYIYSLLTGYEEAPAGKEIAEGTHYNPYFIAGDALAMANPLSDEQVTYDDGAPETVDQYSKDISAFMMWAAEPHLVDRKRMGFMTLLFLAVLAGLLYLVKKQVWAGLKTGVGSNTARVAAAGTAAVAAPIAAAAMAAPKTAPKKAKVAVKKSAPKKIVAKKAPAKKAPTKKAGPVRLKKAQGKADDLKMISGVGPKLEKTLNGLGFWHFHQIAKWKKSDVAIVDNELTFKGRIERDDWIIQAKALAKGGAAEYEKVFGKKPV